MGSYVKITESVIIGDPIYVKMPTLKGTILWPFMYILGSVKLKIKLLFTTPWPWGFYVKKTQQKPWPLGGTKTRS